MAVKKAADVQIGDEIWVGATLGWMLVLYIEHLQGLVYLCGDEFDNDVYDFRPDEEVEVK